MREARRVWCMVALLAALFSGAPARAATEYSVADGLSQNSVLAMVRDAEGFIWLGTEDGLNRFDGYEFRVHRPSDALPAGAPADYVRDLAIADPYLFLATNGGGLVVFDRRDGRYRQFDRAQGLLSDHLTAVELAGEGQLYLASRGGLERLRWQGDPMQARFEVQVLGASGMGEREFWELYAGPSGIWAGSGDALLRIDTNGELLPFDVAGSTAPFNTDALLESPAGVLWVGSWDQGLFRVRLDTGETRRFLPGQSDAQGLRSTRILSLAEGPGGVVYVGTDRGLAWFDPGCDCLKVLNHRRAARFGGRGFLVQSLLADAQGGVFAGYWGEGLVRFSPQDRAFHVEGHREDGPPALNHHRVRTSLESRDGSLWVGSFGGGLQRVRGERKLGVPWAFETVPLGREPDEAARLVWNLLEARDGGIWVGTDAGLFHRRADSEEFVPEQASEDAATMPGVRVLAEDARGRLWVGSSSGLGLLEADGAARRRIAVADANSPLWLRRQMENLQSLHIDAEQRIWLGSWAGLSILDAEGNTLARYGVTEGLPGPIVWDIHRHSDGSLWLATSGGLARVHAGAGVQALRFEALGRQQGMPSGPVLGLVSDRGGHLWITSNRGLLRLKPETGDVRLFTRALGIASDEFATQAESIGRNGWLYFGGIDGLTVFDPERLPQVLEPPRPRVAGLSIDGASLPLPLTGDSEIPKLRLPHDHGALIIDLSGMVFDKPEAVRFRYRLQPDAPLLDLGSRRSLVLDHVPPGLSRLEVEVDNQGELGAARLLSIEVVPPFTSTLWFRGLVLVLALVLLALLYAWRVRALTRQRTQLEREVGERTRELRRQKEALEATALALGEANQRLRTLLLMDPLTGLANRRSLIELMQARFGQGARELPALLLLDLDHFKRINDSCGHQAGDAVLRDFAQLLRSRVPEGGEVGRWGGEEFLCLLPAQPPELAWQWAERLLEDVRQRRVGWDGQALSYRVSAGLARAAAHEDMDSTLARADDALYAAKAAGRDCLRQA